MDKKSEILKNAALYYASNKTTIIHVCRKFNISYYFFTIYLKYHHIKKHTTSVTHNLIEPEIIKKLYTKDHLTITEIAKQFHVSKKAITKTLKELNINVLTQRQRRHLEIINSSKQIITLFNQGKNFKEISNRLNICTDAITDILISKGLYRRKNKPTYKLRQSYFNKINTRNKAYFLGLLCADGCISKSGCSISLKLEDSYLLKKMGRDIYYKKFPFYIKTNHIGQYGILNMCSLRIRNDLIKKTCIERKSLILEFPNFNQVPKKFIWDFIRGYFDGDGCITNSQDRPVIVITSSHKFIKGLNDFLIKEGFDPKTWKTNKVSRLGLYNRISIGKFYKNLYRNNRTNNIFMLRKYKRFLKFKKLNKL